MKTPSDTENSWEDRRDQIIGLGNHSARKSYYPELQQRIRELEQTKGTLATTNQRLQAVLNAASEFSIIACDLNGLITIFNRGAEKMLGYDAAELVGKQTPLVFHLASEIEARGIELSQELGQTVAGFRVFVEQAGLHGSEQREWTHVRKDGTLVPISLTITVMHNDLGQVTGFLGIAEDITERKATERLLLEKEDLLTTIINSIPNPIFYKDAEGKYTGCNDAFCNYLGFPREKIIGATVFDLSIPKLAKIYHQADLDLMRTGGSQVYEASVRYSDNSLHEVIFYKSTMTCQDGSLRGLVGVMLDISEQKQIENELRQNEELFHLLFEKSGNANLLIDGTVIIDCNEATLRILGYPDKQQIISMHPGDLSPEYQPDGRPSAEKANEMMLMAYERGSHSFEWLHTRADGSDLYIEVMLTAIPMHQRWLLHTTWRDLTERKRAEKERETLNQSLLHAQKMESIGRLAGGVAHDFNNLLTPIMGYTEMIRNSLPPEDRNYKRITGVMEAAKKARELTHQLLAFSRKQMLEMKVLDLNQIIKSFNSILERTIRENIAITLKLDPLLNCILGDPTQIEQIIMNMAVNAQDAMPSGGSLVIETSNREFHEAVSQGAAKIAPGSYAQVIITDSGCGMDAETLAHIFEPFYTTKEQGKGTGLGLATVFGIVKQHGGYIFVNSQPGEGTSFRIYLPCVKEQNGPKQASGPEAVKLIDHATILLVEDNPMVRDMTHELLREYGYTILSADGPDQALEIVQKEGPSIDLLLTDVIMPKMSGPALYNALKLIFPGLKVLYMSGYTENIIVDHGMLAESENYIQKPFITSTLIDKVEETIRRKTGRQASTDKGII